MKSQIEIGGGLNLDIPTLLKTRLLVQANSGGGKSWLLRRLAEQLFGKVPVIIIDPEGEFATLREKFGYVLVGKGGETPADLRSAAMVAHKLLELRASAVCDLYELKPQTRHQWVRLFLDALIDAPKELWKPTVIVVDEAHQYAPEGKSGESEASSAMIDLATRGRKRGYCAVFATQRLGKLRKDAAAELLNVMVGMTFIDIDRDRAAECLGVGRDEKHKFNDEIKLLTEGKFYCLGRAICKERTLIKVGGVETTHPEAGGGKFAAEPPPAPEAIKGMLPRLADLPKAAEEKAKTEAELRTEIRTLKTKLTMVEKAQPVAPAPAKQSVKSVPTLTDAERKRLTALINAHEGFESSTNRLVGIAENLRTEASLSRLEIQHFKQLLSEKISSPQQLTTFAGSGAPTARAPVIRRTVTPSPDSLDSNGKLPHGEEKILSACIQFHEGLKREQITVLTTFKRSTRDAYIYRLMTRGLVNDRGGIIYATPDGIAALPNHEPLPVGEELQEHWRQRLPSGERQLFEHIIAAYPNSILRDQLTELTGFKRSTRDAYLYRMSSKMLFSDTGRGEVRASDNLFQ